MAAVKTFALAALVSTALAQASHADPITLQWHTWQPAGDSMSTGLPQISIPFENLFWPAVTPAPQAPVAPPAPAPTPAPSPIIPAPIVQPVPAPAPAPAPAPVFVPEPVYHPAPVVQPAPIQPPAHAQSPAVNFTTPSAPPAHPQPVNAFVNLGAGPYANANQLTMGNAQAWYNSPQIVGFFGGHPTAQQQAAFDSTVIQRVEQTFQLSGVPLTLSSDPNVPAAHTLSVVSNTANGMVPNAIGMTNLGGNGFSFIDQAAHAAQSVDQLEWIVAHNVSHELMLAFGIGEDYDQTGKFIDARNANLSMMLNPNATFSQAASQALQQSDFMENNTTVNGTYAQVLPQPVPEPATIVLWSLGAAAIGYLQRGKLRRKTS